MTQCLEWIGVKLFCWLMNRWHDWDWRSSCIEWNAEIKHHFDNVFIAEFVNSTWLIVEEGDDWLFEWQTTNLVMKEQKCWVNHWKPTQHFCTSIYRVLDFASLMDEKNCDESRIDRQLHWTRRCQINCRIIESEWQSVVSQPQRWVVHLMKR